MRGRFSARNLERLFGIGLLVLFWFRDAPTRARFEENAKEAGTLGSAHVAEAAPNVRVEGAVAAAGDLGKGEAGAVGAALTANAEVAEGVEGPRLRIGVCSDVHELLSFSFAEAIAESRPGGQRGEVVMVERDGTLPAGVDSVHVLICLGYFLNKELTDYSSMQEITPLPEGATQHDLLWNKGAKLWDFSTSPQHHPFNVAFSGEIWDHGDCRFSMQFTTSKTSRFHGCPTVFWPSGPRSMLRRRVDNVHSLVVPPDFDATATREKKYLFAAMIVKSCFSEKYSNEAMLRVIFFHLLSEYKPVYALGNCKPNAPHQPVVTNATYPMRWGGDLDGPSSMYVPFKFAITFENRQHPGYFTEKALNAILGHAVPIYWGAPDLQDMINPEALVVCNVDPALRATFNAKPRAHDAVGADRLAKEGVELFREALTPCVEEVKRLDNDNNAYQRKLQAGVLPNNKVDGSYFDPVRMGRSVQHMLELSHVHIT